MLISGLSGKKPGCGSRLGRVVRRPPTLEDVAQRAGVSTATVSRCLNAPAMVRAETRERVGAAVAELGYTPNFAGRALVSHRTGTIGAVIPTMENAIFALGLQAMQETLSEAATTLLVATSAYDPAREAEQVRALIARGVDGIVLIGEARPVETYRLLETQGVPHVLVWSWRPDSPHIMVGFDNRLASAAVATRVLRYGHRRVAMIAGLTAWNDRAEARVAGVRATLAQAGVALDPPRLVETEYSLEAAAEAARALAALPDRPTAIICGNDVQAAGALRGLRAAGLAVPRDISVVGFDDIEIAKAVEPQLTTVHVPHRRMGSTAAHLLLEPPDMLAHAESVLYETRIVERASLGPPPDGA